MSGNKIATKQWFVINPFQPSVGFYLETIHLIDSANQVTGFYIKSNTGPKWVKLHHSVV